EFPGAPILVAENKSDLKRRTSPHYKISCASGEGIPELLEACVKAVPLDKYQELFSEDATRS
ncbi:MAG TPA: hypothetical protein VI818_02390, partial [Candidatus Thermoplasmatota archaeon]|nr:hypothetical protein [Candidatus Thermoplasmatota archaeon]